MDCLAQRATTAVKEELAHGADSFFDFEEKFELEDLQKSGVEPYKVEYLRHWFDLEESPSFKSMFTMYHMYAFTMHCHNLPQSNFTSVHRSGDGSLRRTCWQWSTWEQMSSVVNQRHAAFERRDAAQTNELSR